MKNIDKNPWTIWYPAKGKGLFLEFTDPENGISNRWALKEDELEPLLELLKKQLNK